ncbi:hypothetical protein [Halarcobacter sp.]|uniref:hypothetical protein n=1 Tax=Halarcobacter sp. TaxID=2321133 RepID=UPI0029F5B6AA|nr:hypothetical protein [Halarcobacter sp.]
MRSWIYIFSLILSIFFTGCATNQSEVKSVFQTNAASLITKDQERIQKLLVKFKTKLDKRNPKNFNTKNEKKIYSVLNDFNKKLLLKYQGKIIKDYKEYLELAFSKTPLLNRNDYLILGLRYMVSYAYDTEDIHNVTALQYDKEKLSKLHKNLQILRWKIKVDMDENNKYLFLTWQNNWQIELETRLNLNKDITYEDIQNLDSIKSNKESLYSHSNFSFEVILTQMIDAVENSLIALGEEPIDLGVSAVKFFIFL